MNIYICDDIQTEAQMIHEEVKKFALFSDTEIIIKNIYTNPEILLKSFKKENEGLNVFILDMDFNHKELNGLVLGQSIKEIDPQSYIIFVTSHAELSFLTFEYRIGAIDYIIKHPHQNWPRKIIDSLQTIEHRIKLATEREQGSIILETSNERKRLAFDDILYFEIAKAQRLIVTTINSSYTINKKTLKALEEELAPHFWRCHRSFLVNKKHIISIKKNKSSLTLTQEIDIPVASRKRGELQSL